MSGNDDIDIPAKDQITGLDPVADGPRPNHRMAPDKQQITGEYGLVLWHIDQRIALGVRRPA